MSDDVDIRQGGAVAVDTDTLRRVADGFASLTGQIDDVQADLVAARALLVGIDPAGTAWRFDGVVHGAAAAADAAAGLADRLRHAAAVYEIVELRAEAATAAAAGDASAVAAARTRLAEIRRGHPLLFLDAVMVQTMWWASGPGELARQIGTTPLGARGMGAAVGMAVLIGMAGRGRIPRGAELTGPPHPVPVTMVGGAPTPASAPTSLAGVVDRMPQGAAQVRVERYGMPDGSARTAVYIAGTRAVDDDREPWNMTSNIELYAGERSASYEATVQALQNAGARPGDTVYLFGHSQGGMIASHLALEGGYDTRALVTFGSPVSAEVGPDTLSVQLRHVDDPVVAFADGGDPAGVGSAGSFIAERVADPFAGAQDLTLAPHVLDEYRDTAAMIDASPDERVGVLDDMFAELGRAESVTAYEYTATTAGPALDPAGVR